MPNKSDLLLLLIIVVSTLTGINVGENEEGPILQLTSHMCPSGEQGQLLNANYGHTERQS